MYLFLLGFSYTVYESEARRFGPVRSDLNLNFCFRRGDGPGSENEFLKPDLPERRQAEEKNPP